MPTQKSITRANKLLDAIELPQQGSLLDVSCGSGAFLERAGELYPELNLYGVDVSAEAVTEAQENNPQVSLNQSPAEQMPFSDRMFDIVVCAMSLHHYHNPETVLKEINRIVRQGGQFYLMDIIAPNKPLQIVYNIVGCHEPYHFEKFYTYSEIQLLLSKSGFTALDLRSVAVTNRRTKVIEAVKNHSI